MPILDGIIVYILTCAIAKRTILPWRWNPLEDTTMRRHAWTALAIAAVVAAAVPWALASDKIPDATSKIKLSLAPLPANAVVFSPAEDVKGGPRLSANAFLPGKPLDFKGKAATEELVIDGVTVPLGFAAPGNFTVKCNDKVSSPKPALGTAGLEPVGLTLSK